MTAFDAPTEKYQAYASPYLQRPGVSVAVYQLHTQADDICYRTRLGEGDCVAPCGQELIRFILDRDGWENETLEPRRFPAASLGHRLIDHGWMPDRSDPESVLGWVPSPIGVNSWTIPVWPRGAEASTAHRSEVIELQDVRGSAKLTTKLYHGAPRVVVPDVIGVRGNELTLVLSPLAAVRLRGALAGRDPREMKEVRDAFGQMEAEPPTAKCHEPVEPTE